MIIEVKLKNISGITIFPFIFVDDKRNKELVNHERIHIRQQIEMLIIPFYLWYLAEWLIRGANDDAYRNISFEREAYKNSTDLEYLRKRKLFGFVKYI